MTTPLDTLRTSLQRVMDEVKFDLGRVTSEYPSGRSTSYNQRQEEVIGPEHLRQMIAEARQDDREAQRAQSARVCLTDELESHLAGSIRAALSSCHDPKSDCVGHAFPMRGAGPGSSTAWPTGIYTHSHASSINRFSATIIKWAAVLGIDRVTDLLAGWARGEPLTYRTCAVIGLTLNKPIEPASGIKITPLPWSTAELPPGLPKRNDIRPSAYLGHALLSVGTVVKPSLFRPGSRYNQNVVKGKLAQGIGFNLISEALSLECNACIETGIQWNDYGDLDILANDRTTWGSLQPLGRPVGWSSSSTSPSRGLTTIEIREDSVQSPSEREIKYLLIALKNADHRTRRAVARWKKSMMRHASVTDGFIDLRIALESLFLPETPNQQLKFRLASNGAWLVGKDGVRRKRAWETLCDAYDTASKAVHQGELKSTDKHRNLLGNAQSVCREGILGVLRDDVRVSDSAYWNDLILDVPRQNPS